MKNNFKKQDQQNQKLVFEKMKKKTDKSVAWLTMEKTKVKNIRLLK